MVTTSYGNLMAKNAQGQVQKVVKSVLIEKTPE